MRPLTRRASAGSETIEHQAGPQDQSSVSSEVPFLKKKNITTKKIYTRTPQKARCLLEGLARRYVTTQKHPTLGSDVGASILLGVPRVAKLGATSGSQKRIPFTKGFVTPRKKGGTDTKLYRSEGILSVWLLLENTKHGPKPKKHLFSSGTRPRTSLGKLRMGYQMPAIIGCSL